MMAATTDPTRLGPGERAANLDRFDSDVFDLVVIGAGVTGLGVAVDAAARGVTAAVIEQRDIAAGTSSRSSKLIHGGLRYLEQLDFGLVREALRERTLQLTEIAPHLVSPVSFVYPLRHRVWERAYVGSGVLLYDLLASRKGNPLPRHRHLSRSGTLRLMPALRSDSLVGGIRYWDASVDDARHSLALARTAAGLGAAVACSVKALGFEPHDGAAATVHARCGETGRDLRLRGRSVVNAAGVWSDRIQALAGSSPLHIRASKGIHLVVPKARIEAGSGLIIRAGRSVLFLVPWGNHWIIGTTDTDWNLDLAHPAASRTDIDYLLSHLNTVLADPLQLDDIEGVYAGLRPLLSGESDVTSKLSREHAVAVSAPGLITVAGGKYTTYRVMARDTVDAAISEGGLPGSPSVTHQLPFAGADGFAALDGRREMLAESSGLGRPAIDRLLGRYGDKIEDLLALIERRPDLGEPLRGVPEYLRAEISYGASHEAALHLNDVLTRRTRISIETKDRGLAAARPAAELMAEILGWSDGTIVRELEHYRARVRAEIESQAMPDDHTADAARLGAADVRRLGD